MCGDNSATPDGPSLDDAAVDGPVDAAIDAGPDAMVVSGSVDVTVYTTLLARHGPPRRRNHRAAVLGSTFAPFKLIAADAGNAQVDEVLVARFHDGWNARRGNVFRDLFGFPYWGGASATIRKSKPTIAGRAAAASTH